MKNYSNIESNVFFPFRVRTKYFKFVRMASVVDRKDRFISDILAMITSGSSNDVKIVLEDGEILANKDVLSARSEYFATMFRNKMFIEGETNQVTFSHCRKVIMEKIIHYLFSGSMNLHDLSLNDLVIMMNMTTMLMVDDLKGDIQQYILEIIPTSGENSGFLPDLVESLMLAEQFKLNTIKKALNIEIYLSLGHIPHIPDVVKNSDAFKHLPYKLLDEIFFEEVLDDPDVDLPDYDRFPQNKEIFDAVVYWLSENDCTSEEKERVKKCYNFYGFTAEELLTDVRKSGLYSIEEVDRRLLDIFRNVERKRGHLQTKKKRV